MKRFITFELMVFVLIILGLGFNPVVIVSFGGTFSILAGLYYLGLKQSYRETAYVYKTNRQLRLMKQYEYGYGNCF